MEILSQKAMLQADSSRNKSTVLSANFNSKTHNPLSVFSFCGLFCDTVSIWTVLLSGIVTDE
jgi:hypothetical protein